MGLGRTVDATVQVESRPRVGVGKTDGTPEIALPLEGQIGATRRYTVGKINVIVR